MRYARGLAAVVLLALGLWPELLRYRSERALRGLQEILRVTLTQPSEVANPPVVLGRVATVAAEAARNLPGDARPWIIAGSARLVNGQTELAIENYRKANALGERAETDLNLGRAYEARGDPQNSHRAFLRAVWISPVLLSTVPPDLAVPLREEMARIEEQLTARRLKAPPPAPQ